MRSSTMVPDPWWTINIFLAVTSHPTIASWTLVRGVAQLGSVSEWGSEGRRFESCRPDNKMRLVMRPAFFIFIGHLSKSAGCRLAKGCRLQSTLHCIPSLSPISGHIPEHQQNAVWSLGETAPCAADNRLVAWFAEWYSRSASLYPVSRSRWTR